MSTYPNYLHKTLAHARDIGQWYCGQADAVALCFDMLALFPDCVEASNLVYELYCDEWTIYNNRVAIQQNIDEWDDRPWQQRRRLAFSFRFMSRWDGWEREYMDGYEQEQDGPPDVAELLENGRMELLGAYCLGDEECTNYAWAIFSDALNRSSNAHGVLLWIGKQYADLGFSPTQPRPWVNSAAASPIKTRNGYWPRSSGGGTMHTASPGSHRLAMARAMTA